MVVPPWVRHPLRELLSEVLLLEDRLWELHLRQDLPWAPLLLLLAVLAPLLEVLLLVPLLAPLLPLGRPLVLLLRLDHLWEPPLPLDLLLALLPPDPLLVPLLLRLVPVLVLLHPWVVLQQPEQPWEPLRALPLVELRLEEPQLVDRVRPRRSERSNNKRQMYKMSLELVALH